MKRGGKFPPLLDFCVNYLVHYLDSAFLVEAFLVEAFFVAAFFALTALVCVVTLAFGLALVALSAPNATGDSAKAIIKGNAKSNFFITPSSFT
jgi:hypothetical protein